MSRAVFFLALVNVVAMGAGFLREMEIAYYFGTSAASDTFSITLLFIEGIALLATIGLGSYMMVPMVSRIAREGPPGTEYALMETLSLWLLVFTLPFGIAAILWPGALVNLLGNHFSAQQRDLLAPMLRLSIPSLPLLLSAGVLGGVLQARADYFTPVFGRALFSVTIACAVAFGAHRYGVLAGAMGILVGALVQFTLQAVVLYRGGWRPRIPAWWHSALPQAIQMGLPTLLALVLTNVLMGNAQRFLASGLPEGSLAAVNYAQRTLNLVASLSLAIGTVSLTELSVEFHSNPFGSKISAILERNIQSGLFLLTPLCLLLFVQSGQVSAILYQRGEFGPSSVALTAKCLQWFTFSVVPAMVLAVLLRAYPAFWRPWAVVWISLFWSGSTVVATGLLISGFQTLAIPAGYFIGVLLAVILSILGLRTTLKRSFFVSTLRYSLRIALCGVVPTGLLLLVRAQSTTTATAGFTAGSAVRQMFPAVALFAAVFILMCLACRDPHLLLVWNSRTVVRIREQFQRQ